MPNMVGFFLFEPPGSYLMKSSGTSRKQIEISLDLKLSFGIPFIYNRVTTNIAIVTPSAN